MDAHGLTKAEKKSTMKDILQNIKNTLIYKIIIAHVKSFVKREYKKVRIFLWMTAFFLILRSRTCNR